MVAAALPAVAADSGTAPESETSIELTEFNDTAGNTFENAINWLVDQGITVGCNPPTYTNFCPDDPVTRGQMAVFITRALSLPAASDDYFDDDNGAFYENSANRLFEAGISAGCNPPANNNFCGGEEVTRAQMATFLNRGFGLAATTVDYFTDDNGSVHETSINRVRSASITVGCNPPVSDRFCPGDTVTRGQMSAFIKRAVEWLTNPQAPPPPPSPGPTPAPTGPCGGNNVIPNAECQALVKLYNSTNGANWTVKSGWLSGNPCTWEGVDCAGANVAEIELGFNNLAGPLPNLTALTQLVELDLEGNFITGSVPAWPGSMGTLRILNLAGNQFSGSIPTQLGNSNSLQELSLRSNLGLNGSIPASLGNIGTLVDLDLSNSGITGTVPGNLGNLTNLQDLDLEFTDVSGALPGSIGGMTSLTSLDISGTLINSLPSQLWNRTSLTSLGLSGMTMLNMDFPAGVAQLTNLTSLTADNSGFTGTIPANIGNIGASLVKLDLSSNLMGGDVPVGIQNLTGLTVAGGGLALDLQGLPGDCFSFSDDTPGAAGPTRTWVMARDAAADVCPVPPAPEPPPEEPAP